MSDAWFPIPNTTDTLTRIAFQRLAERLDRDMERRWAMIEASLGTTSVGEKPRADPVMMHTEQSRRIGEDPHLARRYAWWGMSIGIDTY